MGKAATSNTGAVVITTTQARGGTGLEEGGRMVYTSDGGTTVDWATSTSSGTPYTLSALASYTTLPASGNTTTNDRLTSSGISALQRRHT